MSKIPSDTLKIISDYYDKTYSNELNTASSAVKNKKIQETIAQKSTIKKTAIHFFDSYPELDKNEIWYTIYSLHVGRKSGVDITHEMIDKVKSADQSWIKSSGHAFEEMVKELTNKVLEPEGISVLLQRDITKLLHGGTLKNEERDMEWLTQVLKGDTFDLFIVKSDAVFGCIQSKTSIRDRVTRDREPSIIAMNHFFWSIAFVIDGDFLRLPKFKSMVNGGGKSFEGNGWHGLYAFSLPEGVAGDRIYQLDSKLEIIKNHAIIAYKEWSERRQWFNSSWRVPDAI